MTSHLLTKSAVLNANKRTDLPEFKSGSLVQVHYKIKEGNKERIQIFEGVVISRHGGTAVDASFTVLKVSTFGIKVERNFPLHSPYIEKIEVLGGAKRAKRSKLPHLKEVKDPAKSVKTRLLKPKK
jgi:large subunit ribosomal protein L19